MMRLAIATILTIFIFSCSKKDAPPQLSEIAINCPTSEIKIGDSYQFSASPTPSNFAISGRITWSTTTPSVIEVDNNGKVKALKDGSASITATYSDNQAISKSCSFTVLPIGASSVKLNESSINLLVGENKTLLHQLEPENTTDKTVEWRSENAEIATVDQQGNIKAIKQGQTKIVVKNTKSGLEAFCIVNVETVKPTSITLNKTAINAKIRYSETLAANILPENHNLEQFK